MARLTGFSQSDAPGRSGDEPGRSRCDGSAEGRPRSTRYVRGTFECLNWIVSLDDRVGAIWAPDGTPLGAAWRDRLGGDAHLSAGIRFARNRVHHQWADAIARRDGFRYPRRYPRGFVEWTWRPAEDLPAGRYADGESVYRQSPAGQRVTDSLAASLGVFQFLSTLLEPS